jgi:hypothetical protein
MLRRNLGAVLVAASLALGAASLHAQTHMEMARVPSTRGWLGISFDSHDGVTVVDRVLPGSAAQRAGVADGDTVLRIDGRPASEDEVAALRQRLQAGDTVRLRLRHGGAELERTVIAARRPGNEIAITNGMIRIDGDSSREPVIIRLDSLGSMVSGHVRVMLDSLGIAMHGLPEIMDDNARTMRIYVDSMRGPAREMRIRVDTIRRHLDSLVFRVDSLRARVRHAHPEMNPGEEFEVTVAPDGRRTITRDGNVVILRDTVRDGRREEVRVMTRRVPMREGARMESGVPFFLDVGRRALGGAEMVDLDAALGSYFSTSRGALVLKVSPRTPAARAGLQPGDVVQRVGDRDVSSVADVRAAVNRAPRGSVQLQVLRHGRRHTLTMQWEGAESMMMGPRTERFEFRTPRVEHFELTTPDV